MYKVRFNLGRGENYQKWQITNTSNGEVFYLVPESFNLELRGCTLRNQKGVANKIHEGANKTVCAWINCEEVIVRSSDPLNGEAVRYNPRVNPNWICDGENVDGKRFETLVTYKRNIYIDKL